MSRSGNARIEGLWVPIVTPFTSDGMLDEGSLKRLSQRLVDDGVDGLVALGTTGEPATLSAAERRRVVEVCAEVCAAAGRGLMIGAGTNSTAGTIEEISTLTAGIDAVAALVVVPYYTRPSQKGVVEHFRIVADASPIPLVLYNVPHRTAQGLDAASLLAAGAHENVVAVKQAVGALDADTLEVLSQTGDGFDVLAGDDAFVVPTLLMGGSGSIAAAAHLATPTFVEMVAAARQGDLGRAVRLAEALLPVVTAGFAEPNPAVFKGVLASNGDIDTSDLRRPMTSASSGSVARLAVASDKVAQGTAVKASAHES